MISQYTIQKDHLHKIVSTLKKIHGSCELAIFVIVVMISLEAKYCFVTSASFAAF